jgi:hypothetical protein
LSAAWAFGGAGARDETRRRGERCANERARAPAGGRKGSVPHVRGAEKRMRAKKAGLLVARAKVLLMRGNKAGRGTRGEGLVRKESTVLTKRARERIGVGGRRGSGRGQAIPGARLSGRRRGAPPPAARRSSAAASARAKRRARRPAPIVGKQQPHTQKSRGLEHLRVVLGNTSTRPTRVLSASSSPLTPARASQTLAESQRLPLPRDPPSFCSNSRCRAPRRRRRPPRCSSSCRCGGPPTSRPRPWATWCVSPRSRARVALRRCIPGGVARLLTRQQNNGTAPFFPPCRPPPPRARADRAKASGQSPAA